MLTTDRIRAAYDFLLQCHGTRKKILLQLSGGKDSIACLLILKSAGVYFEAIHFIHRWSYTIPTNQARKIATTYSVKLHIVDVSEELQMALDGVRDRPCRICKGVMDTRTVRFAKTHGFDYICTGDNADDDALVRRLPTDSGLFRYCNRYFNAAVTLPSDIQIIRPLIELTSSDVYSYLEGTGVSVERVGDTGDKYYWYSREGCPLQYKDYAVPYTPDLMDSLCSANRCISTFARERRIRASVHLPSGNVITIPSGNEESCKAHLKDNGFSLSTPVCDCRAWQYLIRVPQYVAENCRGHESFAHSRFQERLHCQINEFKVSDCICSDCSLIEFSSSAAINREALVNVVVEVYHTNSVRLSVLPRQQKVLVFNNGFYGSYESNQHYFFEVCNALSKNGAHVYQASSYDEGARIVKSTSIDGTISFGRYSIVKDGIPFYETFKIPHFQWVSDNPAKLHIDQTSSNITYIFSDAEFPLMLNNLKRRPLYLPIGYATNRAKGCSAGKRDAILFPGQVRDLKAIETEIDRSVVANSVREFIRTFDWNASFILQYTAFCRTNCVVDADALFRLCNSYIRTRKRIFALEAVRSKDVYVTGIPNACIRNPRVHYLPVVRHSDIADVMSGYKYVLNVDPNYHATLHERMLLAISAGTVCISNCNSVVCPQRGFPEVFTFPDCYGIDAIIAEVERDYDSVLARQREFIRGLDWYSSCEVILKELSER